MGLAKYNQKRDFTKTKEPKGVTAKTDGKLRFVVQKHAASRLHYDFRLEVNGVMVSWAVPKGPSANPADKRLAMQVEDHPIGYMNFEGTIPKGEYGGGTVMVWDIGTYHVEDNDDPSKDNTLMKKMLRDGNVKIVLEGEKLHGSWHLVEMKKEDDRRQWLLMKHKDEFAGKKKFNELSILTGRDLDEIAKGDKVWHSNKTVDENLKALAKPSKPKTEKIASETFSAEDLSKAKRIKSFPRDWRPQLATLADEPFKNDEWLFETKYDGYRALAMVEEGKADLVSRNGLSFKDRYSEISETLESLPHDLVLDGEIVVEDSKGKSNFQSLQNYENSTRGKLKFYVFDILYFNGFDLKTLALVQRKKILKAILPKLKNIIYSEHTLTDGIKAFKAAEKKGGEGIIAKKIDSTYHENKRTKDWLKIKTEMQQEMVIGGFTEPSGSRKGIGALLCGFYKDGKLKYSGKVGSGYTEKILIDLEKKLTKIETDKCPFSVKPKLTGKIHWVKPELLAQVKFSEWTETESMRHPVFLGLREDKPAKKVTMEKPVVDTEEIDEKSQVKSRKSKEASNDERRTADEKKSEASKVERRKSNGKKSEASNVERRTSNEKKSEEKSNVKRQTSNEKKSEEKSNVKRQTSNEKKSEASNVERRTSNEKKSEEKSNGERRTADEKKSEVSNGKKTTSKVEFSNLDKIFWPKEKITKGDVIDYYDRIADYILPYLKDRPQSLRRTPDGIKSEGFFQKNVAGMVPKWVKTKIIKAESADEPIEWLLCQDKDTLLYLANLGCIEMNPWSSRVRTLDHPDYIIFDLDPNQADMKKLVKTALKVKEILDKLKIKGYVKTSGGKGIHVFIPVLPKYTYEQTRDFSLLISQMVHRELPDITSLERMPKKRIGKVYLDYLQNGKGKTMASIYSIRPREGAGVSTPLDWDELNDKLDLQKFNIKTIPDRLEKKGDLWKDFFDNAIDLKKTLAGL